MIDPLHSLFPVQFISANSQIRSPLDWLQSIDRTYMIFISLGHWHYTITHPHQRNFRWFGCSHQTLFSPYPRSPGSPASHSGLLPWVTSLIHHRVMEKYGLYYPQRLVWHVLLILHGHNALSRNNTRLSQAKLGQNISIMAQGRSEL